MILKALYDYYKRNGNLPKKGLEFKEIGFLLVLNRKGNFIRFEDRRIDNKHAQEFLVKKSVGRTSAPKANYLYDNSAYVFGYSDKEDDSTKYFKEFKSKVEAIHKVFPNSPDLKAIYAFYQNDRETIIKALEGDSLWSEVVKNLNKKYSTFSFLIEGDTKIVAEKQEFLSLSDEQECTDGKICLILGNKSHIVETTAATMIPGSQATAKLVSFQVKSGYDSYGKNKGNNAPISKEAEFAYTTALNYMLRSDSRNKFLIGNRTFVFWASKNDEVGKQTEECIWDMFGFNDSNDDDPNHGIEQVRKVFRAIYSGSLQTTMDDKFYILGLAPNTARIAVTYWAEIPLKVFAERINNHFDNMEIVDNERKIPKPYMGLRSIVSSIALDGKINGKDSKLTPNLPEAVVKSIFQGLPYPYTLFVACIHRIRAEQQVPKEHKEEMKWLDTMVCRIAIIKAYLNRLNNNEQKIGIMLDKENKNQGYLCGRLFAVLDRKQEKARNQRSIRERYMNSASSTPSIVFPTILNLSSHHEKELKDDKERIWFEKLEQDIMKRISADGFPAHLDLQDQGRFFVGYYHQRQDFFEKKTANNENE